MDTLVAKRPRIASIDLLRGLVMIIMALDHTRDFFHSGAFTGDPLDPVTTTPALYFTRWVTHFCAPVFVFLAGTSAWLQSQRKTKAQLSRFLVTRGFWLIIVELTLVTFGITGDIYFGLFTLQTIWSIGISMVILGIVIRLPFNLILLIGLLIVFGHNTIDFAEKGRTDFPLWWQFLHRPGFMPLDKHHGVGIFYPFLSWSGLMMLGYCCGKIFSDVEEEKRNRILLWTGIGALIFFAIMRAIAVYGDPLPWSQQKNWWRTFLSFMNVQKYPPSLLYMCATIGPALIFLSLIKNTSGRLSKIISVYGRVPFFYYILHFYLLHIIAIVVFLAR
ncbi:MAG TPA: heparan-alpha-glucosaminide N-acetyltransferase domain-containing protein, partial [Ferruginibacter sp.]|nr:heparan-alpha-glucosaminide N-acetyltransferase domain-containing protein [Ferruginibacter sp.]